MWRQKNTGSDFSPISKKTPYQARFLIAGFFSGPPTSAQAHNCGGSTIVYLVLLHLLLFRTCPVLVVVAAAGSGGS
ncbi:hypothetical protein DL98DRAFT_512532 [Cadophora sp. DSE1049]|nr:hypothetical protein DL98DRAFT_512532 [Cadophora sp. DSE1049]